MNNSFRKTVVGLSVEHAAGGAFADPVHRLPERVWAE
jgi:hypothetical protein